MTSSDSRAAPRRTKSQRRLTPMRMFVYRLAVAIGVVIFEVLWWTGRIRVLGEERLAALIREQMSVVPVFWHQHLLICGRYLLARRVPGMKPGVMVSPSVDGEAPAMLATLYGAHVVRGSGSYTGVRAIRGVHQAIVKAGVSPAFTPDGPRGPRFVLKPGAIFTAQITGKPVVPIAYAAKPAWKLKTWDKFIIPWPFAKIRIAIGEPMFIAEDLDAAQLASAQREMERRLHETYCAARDALRER